MHIQIHKQRISYQRPNPQSRSISFTGLAQTVDFYRWKCFLCIKSSTHLPPSLAITRMTASSGRTGVSRGCVTLNLGHSQSPFCLHRSRRITLLKIVFLVCNSQHCQITVKSFVFVFLRYL